MAARWAISGLWPGGCGGAPVHCCLDRSDVTVCSCNAATTACTGRWQGFGYVHLNDGKEQPYSGLPRAGLPTVYLPDLYKVGDHGLFCMGVVLFSGLAALSSEFSDYDRHVIFYPVEQPGPLVDVAI